MPAVLPTSSNCPLSAPCWHHVQEYLPIIKEEEAYVAVEKNASGSRPKELFQVSAQHD